MTHHWTERTAGILLGLYAFDRITKLATVIHFFGRAAPPAPQHWPSVTLIQPVTVGATALAHNLRSRLDARYGGVLDHVLVCDGEDDASIRICRDASAASPEAKARIVTVAGNSIASKTTKLEAGLADAPGAVVCFIDDDVALRPGALDMLVKHLIQPDVGAVFGLAAYVCWHNIPSSLLSLFVNHNALVSYVPLSYLTEPFTITGHCYAVLRSTLDQVGAFRGMESFIDDDHDLAQRIQALGLRNVQTPLVYNVSNALPTMQAYGAQMKRWFVFPRQCMMPHMTGREQGVSLLGSAGNFLVPLLALLALLTRQRAASGALGASLALAAMVQWLLEARYIEVRTPAHRWLLFPLVVVATPFQIIAALLSDDTVEWRGQRLEVQRGGLFVLREDHPSV